MKLKGYRNKIDSIDQKIICLLNQRARYSLAIGKEKLKSKKGIYAPDREKEILKRIKTLNYGPMPHEAFEAIYREKGFVTPRPDELPELLGKSASEIMPLLDYLCQKGTLVRLGKNVVFHQRWLQEAERRVVREIQEAGRLDSADFKARIGSSRKYALAILDHFDTIHITLRSGNLRRLHPAYLRKHPELAGPNQQ